MRDERFQIYLRQLYRNYSSEKLEHMLDSLGIQLASERETYSSDYEYAADLLGTTPEELEAALRDDQTVPEGPALEARRTDWRITALLAVALGALIVWALWHLFQS